MMVNEEHLRILKQAVDYRNQWRQENTDIQLDLSQANLGEADLRKANLRNANLNKANLSEANLLGANLRRADLKAADLSGVDLSGVDLRRANLTKATVGYTTFANVDLSTVTGIETIQHRGASTIGIDTIYLSQGKIPEIFLRVRVSPTISSSTCIR